MGSRFYARDTAFGRNFFVRWFENRCSFKDQRGRRADVSPTNRGDAAAADRPRKTSNAVARRGSSAETGRSGAAGVPR